MYDVEKKQMHALPGDGNETKERCNMCAHACLLRSPSCRKGQEYAAWYFSPEGEADRKNKKIP